MQNNFRWVGNNRNERIIWVEYRFWWLLSIPERKNDNLDPVKWLRVAASPD